MTFHDHNLETKAEAGGATDVPAAIADMTKAFEDKFATLKAETKAATDTAKAATDTAKAATDRADALEAKMSRPGAAGNQAEPTAEAKSFTTFVRKGITSGDEVKALIVSSETAGGVLAPPEFTTEMIRNLVQISPVRVAARVASTGSQSVLIPRRTANLTAYWVGETENRSPTQPAYGQLDIPVNEMACYIDGSNQQLEDSAVDINAELEFDLGQEFGRLEGASFVNGSGIKQPVGFLNAAAGITILPSGSSGSIAGDNIISTFYSLPAPYRARSTWMMNSQAMGIIRTLKDGAGRYIWMEGIATDQPPTLLGRPVIDVPDMPAPAANSLSIAFGDWSSGYRIYDRLGLTVLRDPYTQATNGLTRFHARRRVGANVVLPEALRIIKFSVS